MSLVPMDHPLRKYFTRQRKDISPANVLREAQRDWLAACRCAVYFARNALLREHGVTAQARWSPYYISRPCSNVYWLYEKDVIAWVNVVHRLEKPTPDFPEAPSICTVAANAMSPLLGKTAYFILRRQGLVRRWSEGRPISWWRGHHGGGDCAIGVPLSAMAHPPAFLIHCHQKELEDRTTQAALWVAAWKKGETAPFRAGLPAEEYPRVPEVFWTPLAAQVQAAWDEIILQVTPQKAVRMARRKTPDVKLAP